MKSYSSKSDNKSSKYSEFSNLRQSHFQKGFKIIQDKQVLKFSYEIGKTYGLTNRDLKMLNQNAQRTIIFKIQSTNPSHYKVHPSSGQIPPGKSVQILIQVVMTDQILDVGSKAFAKYKADKFRISYNYKSEIKSKKQIIEQIQKCIILNVEFDFHDENTQQIQTTKKNNQISQKIVQKIDVQRKKLIQLNKQIQMLQNKNNSQDSINNKCLLFICIIAFICGLSIKL